MTAHDETKLKLQVYLSEYGKLREELLQNINHEQQSLVLVLGSASIAIPLLAGQVTATSGGVIAGLLYLLSIVYSVITLNKYSAGFNLSVISKYIHTKLEPEINKLFQTVPEGGIFIWESLIPLHF